MGSAICGPTWWESAGTCQGSEEWLRELKTWEAQETFTHAHADDRMTARCMPLDGNAIQFEAIAEKGKPRDIRFYGRLP